MTTTAASLPPRSLAFRVVWYVISIAMVGLGIAMAVSAHLGVAPGDVLSTGGSERFGIGVGTMGWITGGTFTVIAVLMKRYPRVGTVLGMVSVGQIVNWCLQFLPEPEQIVARIPMYAVGLALIYMGIVIGIGSNLGSGPIELVMLGINDRGLSLQVGRIILEALILVVGILLGGQFGAGTIIFVIITGPILERLLPVGARFMRSTPADVQIETANTEIGY